jgi:hypothetical protein
MSSSHPLGDVKLHYGTCALHDAWDPSSYAVIYDTMETARPSRSARARTAGSGAACMFQVADVLRIVPGLLQPIGNGNGQRVVDEKFHAAVTRGS